MTRKCGKLDWKVDTPSLLKEILENPECAILNKPINIFARLLAEVAVRASELNDAKMNRLMIRLNLYDVEHEKEQSNAAESDGENVPCTHLHKESCISDICICVGGACKGYAPAT